MLLEAGADLEARAEDGQTPLHYASTAAFSETAAAVVAALLEAGRGSGGARRIRLHPAALRGACRVAWNRYSRSGVARSRRGPECAGQR